MRTDTYLGRLGNPEGVNVARVEVITFDELGNEIETAWFAVHATGDEPECEGEYGTIYAVFEKLVHERMEKRIEMGLCDSWETLDTSSM